MDTTLRTAVELLHAARAVACLTGAGVSAESGVPTFRDAQTGLWARYDPQMLASPQGFAEDPGLVWRWYMARLAGVEKARPNPGHLALAQMQDRRPAFALITQNVDDLHERAGSRDVIHLHGTIAHFRCHRCATPHPLTEAERSAELPPVCSVCGGHVRPAVVWFGESLPSAAYDRAVQAVSTCDLLLVIGTSGLVYPAAQLPAIAKRAGSRLMEINPEPGPLSSLADVTLRGPSGEILPRLWAAVTGEG